MKTYFLLILLCLSQGVHAIQCEEVANKYLGQLGLGQFSRPTGKKVHDTFDSENYRLTLAAMRRNYDTGLKKYAKDRSHAFSPPATEPVWANEYNDKGGGRAQLDAIDNYQRHTNYLREMLLKNQGVADETFEFTNHDQQRGRVEVFAEDNKISAIAIHNFKEDRTELIRLDYACKIQSVSQNRHYDVLRITPRVCESHVLNEIKSEVERDNLLRPIVEPLGGQVPYRENEMTQKRSGNGHMIAQMCTDYKEDLAEPIAVAPKPAPTAPSGKGTALRGG